METTTPQHDTASPKPPTIKHHTFFCNRCPVSKIVENMANETAERIELARNTCTACNGHNSDAPFWTDGKSWVHYDGAKNGATFALTMADPTATAASKGGDRKLTDLPVDVEEAAEKLIYLFTSLSRTQILVFHALMHGMDYKQAGEYAGVSKQAAHMAAFKAYHKYPALLTLAPQKFTKVRDAGKVARSLADKRKRELTYANKKAAMDAARV